MKIGLMCGPTCGCGKTYEVEADGREHNCPHCGKWWGKTPVSEDNRVIFVGLQDAAAEKETKL